MKPAKTTALFLVLAFALAAAQAKPKKQHKPPAVFAQARYVYVEAVDGDEYDPRLNPYDRQAIADVEEALRGWKRYVLTMRPSEADLIIVVRKGRLASAKMGVQVGAGPQGYPGPGASGPLPGNAVGVGGEVGPPDDLLEVYMPNPGNPRGTILWQRSMAGGLDPPFVPLLQQLKREVERAYPEKSGKKQKP